MFHSMTPLFYRSSLYFLCVRAELYLQERHLILLRLCTIYPQWKRHESTGVLISNSAFCLSVIARSRCLRRALYPGLRSRAVAGRRGDLIPCRPAARAGCSGVQRGDCVLGYVVKYSGLLSAQAALCHGLQGGNNWAQPADWAPSPTLLSASCKDAIGRFQQKTKMVEAIGVGHVGLVLALGSPGHELSRYAIAHPRGAFPSAGAPRGASGPVRRDGRRVTVRLASGSCRSRGPGAGGLCAASVGKYFAGRCSVRKSVDLGGPQLPFAVCGLPRAGRPALLGFC